MMFWSALTHVCMYMKYNIFSSIVHETFYPFNILKEISLTFGALLYSVVC